MTRVYGIDLSLNHWAVVELDDGEMSGFVYATDVEGSASKSKTHGIRFKVLEAPRGQRIDPILRGMHRLGWIEARLSDLLRQRPPEFGGIEDYAYDQAQGAHQLGEAGAIARMLMWRKRIPFRAHDISSIKLFAAHHGLASKDDVREAVRDRWGIDFTKYDAPPAKKSGKPNTRTSEDLSDAFVVAKMVWTEVQLRRGQIKLSDLHEKEIQVFNRTTNTRPVNILATDWIVRE